MAEPSQRCRWPRLRMSGRWCRLFRRQHVIFTVAGIAFTRAHLFGLLLIAILTYVNVVGLRWGALLQNVSTWTKFTAMAAFVVLGFAIGKGNWSNFHARRVSSDHGPGANATDLGAGSGIDRGVLGLRRMGIYHVGGGRSERSTAQCSSGDGAGSAGGGA